MKAKNRLIKQRTKSVQRGERKEKKNVQRHARKPEGSTTADQEDCTKTGKPRRQYGRQERMHPKMEKEKEQKTTTIMARKTTADCREM